MVRTELQDGANAYAAGNHLKDTGGGGGGGGTIAMEKQWIGVVIVRVPSGTTVEENKVISNSVARHV